MKLKCMECGKKIGWHEKRRATKSATKLLLPLIKDGYICDECFGEVDDFFLDEFSDEDILKIIDKLLEDDE